MGVLPAGVCTIFAQGRGQIMLLNYFIWIVENPPRADNADESG
jgi:hypothetical protein